MSTNSYIQNEYDVSDIVKNLSVEIEEDYLVLTDKFKELFNELEQGFTTTNLMLKIDVKSKDENIIKDEVVKLLNDAKEVVNNASEYFTEMNEKDLILYSHINSNIEQLNALKIHIRAIREDTTDLELLSINAMVVAIKAGIEGKGFSFITDELKKLSSKTIIYTQELSKQGNRIVLMFTDFQKEIEKLKKYQERFYSKFTDNLDDGFNNFSNGLQKIEKMVSEVIEKSQNISKPIFKIMDEIQFQDIIKQSLEHVIMSMNEIQFESKKDEESINKYAVIEVLSEISINLLSDVEQKITNCFATYKSNFILLREILDNIELEKQNFIREAKKYKINDIVEKSTIIIDKLVENIDNTLGFKNNLFLNLKTVKQDISKLTKYFSKYFEIIKRFSNIELVSKIEIEKREALRNRKEITGKMTDLTKKIEKDVNESMKDIEESNKISTKIVNDFQNSINMEFSVAKDFTKRIKTTKEILINYNNNLQNSISNFKIYSEYFFQNLDDTEKKIKNLYEKTSNIASIKTKLYDINNNASKRKKELLRYNDLEKWDIKDDKIIDMINKFTILTHKQLAGNIVGVSVEQGDDAGKLTLF